MQLDVAISLISVGSICKATLCPEYRLLTVRSSPDFPLIATIIAPSRFLSRLISKAMYDGDGIVENKTLINIRLFVCDQYNPIIRFIALTGSLLSAKFAILHSANERLRDSGEQGSRVRV